MKTYELCLYDKLQKDLIDNTLFYDCENRNDAMQRVKNLMMRQGLRLSEYGYTLKISKKVENVDLFDLHYADLPTELVEVLNTYSEMDNTYENCGNLVDDLNKIGYTCDYYLDAEPYNLRKINENNVAV
jgi:hypothetical protein